MERSAEDPHAALLRRIQDGLRRADAHAGRLRRTNARLLYLSLAGSALATVLAGLTAAAGPLAGQGPPAWRITCGAIAVLTAASGPLSGIHQHTNVADRLAKAVACAGRLRALELALTVTGRDVLQVARDYEDVLSGYQEYVL